MTTFNDNTVLIVWFQSDASDRRRVRIINKAHCWSLVRTYLSHGYAVAFSVALIDAMDGGNSKRGIIDEMGIVPLRIT